MKIIVYLSLVMITTTSCEKNYNCVCRTSETNESSVTTNFSVNADSKSQAENNCKANNSTAASFFISTTTCKLQ
jgi:hypothetical protein